MSPPEMATEDLLVAPLREIAPCIGSYEDMPLQRRDSLRSHYERYLPPRL